MILNILINIILIKKELNVLPFQNYTPTQTVVPPDVKAFVPSFQILWFQGESPVKGIRKGILR